jgi:hypothetical protein
VDLKANDQDPTPVTPSAVPVAPNSKSPPQPEPVRVIDCPLKAAGNS